MNIYPSLISANLLALGSVIEELDIYADGYHVDIMDNHFVPNLTWGSAFIDAFMSATQKPLHIHYMVDNPAEWFLKSTLRAQDVFIFHYEAFSSCEEVKKLAEDIRLKNIQVGIAFNPSTPLEALINCFSYCDYTLIMSVQPGFSGQTFIEDVMHKVASLVAFKKKSGSRCRIGMDGGITKHHIARLKAAGVEDIATASALFSMPHPVQALKELKMLAKD